MQTKSTDHSLVLDRTTADFYLLEGLDQEILMEDVGEYCDIDTRKMRLPLSE